MPTSSIRALLTLRTDVKIEFFQPVVQGSFYFLTAIMVTQIFFVVFKESYAFIQSILQQLQKLCPLILLPWFIFCVDSDFMLQFCG